MSRIVRILIVVVGLVLASISGCDTGGEMVEDKVIADRINRYMDKTKADEVRQLIAKELQVGANADVIEAFFDRHHIAYEWDRFAKIYVGIIRDLSTNPKLLDHSVLIDIYVDDEKRFVNAEVQDSFK
jgi:hypothetical protein